MKKITFIVSATLIIACTISSLLPARYSEAATDTVSLTANVTGALTLGLSSASYSFGDLTPGTPVRGSSGIDINVETSSANGYTLAVHDSIAGANSALLHTDTTTRIADYSSLIASPTTWNNGTDTGLGFTAYSAETSKEIKWGSGTTYNDANNTYAGVPQNATVFHTSPNYKAGVDTTSISFILDVPVDQKTGSYSGIVTVTALPTLE